ncbi:hypothetical protein Pmani_032624 [Petrolisthes manimaculis]|uniref:C2H2-type domain-containing protein n=1 Tax=Petrolisthes manimaculis TaxID=1843537 RepID=A0AAE1NS96_9EUCA|nr:hypothetical protein Pmani_032624 [Petrolisthes manimaculis]
MCLYIQPKRRPQGQKVTKRLNVEKLKSSDVIHELQAAINDKLSVPLTTSDTIEDQWAHLRDSTYSTALEIIGPKNKKHQDWFDENDSEIQPLLEEKRQLLRAHQSDPRCVAKKAAFTNIRSKVQARLRSMQDAWLSAKADEIQEHADNHDVRKFYDALRAVYGPQSSGSSPLLSSDGTTLLNDKKQILYRWAEHFNSVLNRPSTINDEAINQLRQEPINEELDIPPSSEEVSKAIKQLSSGKAPGPDSIPAEVYISGGPTLLDAIKDSHSGFDIKYRCDGKLFNIRRMQAVTRVKETIIRDLLFADDCALNAPNETEMQHQMDRFSTGCDNFGLTISTKKTEAMYQPAPGDAYHEPCITVKGQKLHAVEQFTYLGSTLSRTANIDTEVNHRISTASSAFGRLRDNVWKRRGITLETKLKVYRAAVQTTLLYGCETWTPYKRHENQLNGFQLRCLRSLLNIRWQDRIPDTEVLKRAGLQTITTIIRKTQLQWAGHVSRMPDGRIPKQLFYGELSQGKRTAGGQKKRYKDCLKTSLKDFDINPQSWESRAAERSAWRCAISLGADRAEDQRATHAQRKRERRKERTAGAQPANPAFTCPECGRVCRARIGLISHLRTHRPPTPN